MRARVLIAVLVAMAVAMTVAMAMGGTDSVTRCTPPLSPSLKVPSPRPPASTWALITTSAASAVDGARGSTCAMRW